MAIVPHLARGELRGAGIAGAAGRAILREISRGAAEEAVYAARQAGAQQAGRIAQAVREYFGPAPPSIPRLATPTPTAAPAPGPAPKKHKASKGSTTSNVPQTVQSSPAFREKVVAVANRAKQRKGVPGGPSAKRADASRDVPVRVNTVDWSMPVRGPERVDRVPFAFMAYTPEQVTSGTDPFTQWGLVDQRSSGKGTSTGNGVHLQPASGDMGPDLANIALRYTHWRLHSLTATWKPFAGSADRGKVYVIIDPLPNLVQPATPQEVIASCLQCNSSVGVEWERHVPLNAIDNRWRQTRTTEYFGVERKTFDGCTVWCDTDSTNLPAGSKIGVLELSGYVELKCISRIPRVMSVDARVAIYTIAASSTVTTTNLAPGFVNNVGRNRTGVGQGPTGLLLAPGVYRVRATVRFNPATWTSVMLRLAGTALTFNEYNTAGVPPATVFGAAAGVPLTLGLPPAIITVTDAPNTNVLTLEVVTTGTTSFTVVASETVGGAQGATTFLMLERIDV